MDLATPRTPHASSPLLQHSAVSSLTPQTPNIDIEESNTVQHQAVPDESNEDAAKAGSTATDSSFSSSSSSTSSASSTSSLDGSQLALPLQRASSGQSGANTHGQIPPSMDSHEPHHGLASTPDTAASALNASSTIAQTGIQATAAAAASIVSSCVQTTRDYSNTASLPSSDDVISHDQQAGLSVSDRGQAAALGMPSGCVGCFLACVETCATTGLGLDALNAALLELTNAPSLASGSLLCLCLQRLVSRKHSQFLQPSMWNSFWSRANLHC